MISLTIQVNIPGFFTRHSEFHLNTQVNIFGVFVGTLYFNMRNEIFARLM